MGQNQDLPSKHFRDENALKAIPKTLLIGYGNPDREDDGVAWHVLRGVANTFGLEIPNDLDEDLVIVDENLHFLFNLQLLPEMTYEMSKYARICFVRESPDGLDVLTLAEQQQIPPQ